MKKWQERLIPGQAGIKELDRGATTEEDPAAIARAEEVARHTREFLATQGWCLWKCSVLGGEIIARVLDENVEGVPGGYPVYTIVELEELCQGDISEATLRLVHEAKRIAGAVVVSVEGAERLKEGGES